MYNLTLTIVKKEQQYYLCTGKEKKKQEVGLNIISGGQQDGYVKCTLLSSVLIDHGREATGIEDWVPSSSEYRCFIKREREREQGCPSCSGACTMATTKCTFLEKGSWSNPLAPKVPCAHTLGNRVSMVGARGAGRSGCLAG